MGAGSPFLVLCPLFGFGASVENQHNHHNHNTHTKDKMKCNNSDTIVSVHKRGIAQLECEFDSIRPCRVVLPKTTYLYPRHRTRPTFGTGTFVQLVVSPSLVVIQMHNYWLKEEKEAGHVVVVVVEPRPRSMWTEDSIEKIPAWWQQQPPRTPCCCCCCYYYSNGVVFS